MQTKFAILSFHNTYLGMKQDVLVAVLNKKWAGVRLRQYDAPSFVLFDSGYREPRAANTRTSVGTLNTDKPFTEIGMLVRRHTALSGSARDDDPSDWKLTETKELTPSDFVARHGREGFWAGMTTVVTRVLCLDDRGELLHWIDTTRINNLITNWHTNCARKDSNQLSNVAYRYVGLLESAPGTEWKGVTYDTGMEDLYLSRKNDFAQLGSMLRKAIGYRKQFIATNDPAKNPEGLVADIEELLTDNARIESLHSSSSGSTWPETVERLMRETLGSSIGVATCGHFEYTDTTHSVRVGGRRGTYQRWCSECFDARAVLCEDNEEYWAREDAYYSEEDDAYYTHNINDESAEYEDGSRAIMDYSTNVTNYLKRDPKIVSSPYGEFLMGLEIELTTGSSPRTRVSAAKDIRTQLGKDYCVIKNDGSLPDDGFELVTAPRGLAEHIERLSKWNIDPGFRAWDTDRCGLHVHIHSRAFTEMTFGKFLMFLNLDTNAPFLRKLAGRHPIKDAWAARYCAQEGMEILENPKAAVKGKSSERYRIVNVQNLGRGEAERLGLDPFRYAGRYDTVELRIFKASLKKARMLAQVEFAHAAVAFCRVAGYKDLSGTSFLQWLKPNTALYPHLADWYGVRKSKAIKDNNGEPLEKACPDKVRDELVVPQRAVRVTRRAPLTEQRNLNEFLTPAARRQAEEQRLQELVTRERDRLRAARERAASLRNA